MKRRHGPGRTVRIVVTAFLGAALAAPAVATATPSGADAPGFSRLAGTTTVYAAHSSRAVVWLPRAVTLPTAPGDNHLTGLSISGRGRMTGFALVSPDARTGFVELSVSPCFDARCDHPLHGYARQQIADSWSPTPPPVGASKAPTGFTLPAGDYTLSVFTDGAPVHVTLRLPQMSGRTHIVPRLPRHAQITTPPERSAAGPASPLSSQASATGEVHTAAVMLGFEHISEGNVHVSNDVSWCVYAAPGPPAGTFTDGCPGGSGVTLGGTYLTLSDKSETYGLMIMTGQGSADDYFQGVDDTGVQELTDVHDNLLWADLGTVVQSS